MTCCRAVHGDLIVSEHFLARHVFPAFPRLLRPGGMLFVLQPTQTNLQRHEKPPARFLLNDGELPTLIDNLEVVRYEEGWLAEGRCEALLLARRPSLTNSRAANFEVEKI